MKVNHRGGQEKPPVTHRRGFALVILVSALLAGFLLLVITQPARTPRIDGPPLPTTVPTTRISPTYVWPSEQVDEDGYLQTLHLNGVHPKGYSDKLLLDVGHSTCQAWEDGVTYTQTVAAMKHNLDTWTEHDRDVAIIASAQHLCPQFDGKYGA